jgi:hypothetical protein
VGELKGLFDPGCQIASRHCIIADRDRDDLADGSRLTASVVQDTDDLASAGGGDQTRSETAHREGVHTVSKPP